MIKFELKFGFIFDFLWLYSYFLWLFIDFKEIARFSHYLQCQGISSIFSLDDTGKKLKSIFRGQKFILRGYFIVLYDDFKFKSRKISGSDPKADRVRPQGGYCIINKRPGKVKIQVDGKFELEDRYDWKHSLGKYVTIKGYKIYDKWADNVEAWGFAKFYDVKGNIIFSGKILNQYYKLKGMN